MFRDFIPLLDDRFHLVAPDLPGFGFSAAPPRSQFTYTFAHLTQVLESFTDILGLARYALYVFDYGAPVGFRLAVSRPERVTAILSQNGNAYEEGLSTNWNPIQKYWQDPSPENREALRAMLTPETTRWQYLHGVPNEKRVAPESYTLDSALMARPGNDEIQLDLFLDYASNVALYPTFQAYFAARQPPLLAAWGKNDPFFLPSGAEAFRRDLPDAEIRSLRHRPLRARDEPPRRSPPTSAPFSARSSSATHAPQRRKPPRRSVTPEARPGTKPRYGFGPSRKVLSRRECQQRPRNHERGSGADLPRDALSKHEGG